jgi:hypothetical protein
VARKVGSGLAFEVYDTNLSHIAPRFRVRGYSKGQVFRFLLLYLHVASISVIYNL